MRAESGFSGFSEGKGGVVIQSGFNQGAGKVLSEFNQDSVRVQSVLSDLSDGSVNIPSRCIRFQSGVSGRSVKFQ